MSDKPNIILINCDDLGYGDLGCYGSEHNDTPNLDNLASEGMRFTDFYMVSPVCSASRAGMMTGCYSQRIGFGQCQVLFPGQKEGLSKDEVTIADQLKSAGYHTKIIGKWHCGDQPEFLPTSHGFDEYFGIPFSNDMGRQANNHMAYPPLPLMRNGEVIQQQPDQRGITERYVDDALQFMRKNSDSPFFLYFAHMYVHVPLFIPKQFLDISRNGAYGGAVACIDWAFAMLDAELDRLGLKDNTIVIFTSDNGSRAGGEGGSNGPLRGTKAQTWEGGQRVPFIVRWPGRIKAGSTCSGIASSMDLFATISDIVDVSLPKNRIDSISMKDIWLQCADSKRDEFAYYKGGTLEAIRKGDWKLHFCKTGWNPETNDSTDASITELYNLCDDIGESNNIYDEHPDVVAELNSIADKYRQMFGDIFTGVEGEEVRPCGFCEDAEPLTVYDENHPYMIACYDLADMPTMSG